MGFSEYQQIPAVSDGLKGEFENKSLSGLQKQTMFGNVLASKFKQTVFKYRPSKASCV